MPQPRRHTSDAQRQAAYRRRRRDRLRNPALPTAGIAALPSISQMPGTVRWRQSLRTAQGLLEMVEGEMQEYYDSRSENWQEGDKGQEFQERLDALTDACEKFDDLV